MQRVNRTVSCLGVAGALVLLSSVGVGQAATPLRTLNGDGFSIGLPGKPARQALSLGIIGKEVLYLVKGHQRAAGIGYLNEPHLSSPVDLAATISGEALGAGGSSAKVHDSNNTTYEGFRARDARITIRRHGVTAMIFTRVIDTTKRLYILTYVVTGSKSTKVPSLYGKIRLSLTIA